MKKLLGISLVAALAVSPMMAMAEAGDRTATKASLAENYAGSSTNVATTSYVKGAYKAASDRIDALLDDTAVATDGSYIDAGKTVSHNLKELDTQLSTVSGTVANYSTDLNAKQNKTDSEVTAAEAEAHSALTAGTAVHTNLVSLATAIENEATARSNADALKQDKSESTVANGTYNYITQGTGVGTNLVALDTNLKSVSDRTANYTNDLAAKQNASESTVANGTYNYITQGTGVGSNLQALDTAVKNVSDSVGTATTGYKKGIVSTINHSTAATSGTLTVYTNFNDEQNGHSDITISTTGTVSAPGTNHNEYYATYDGSAETLATGTNGVAPAPAQP